jgi:hypothetical protein
MNRTHWVGSLALLACLSTTTAVRAAPVDAAPALDLELPGQPGQPTPALVKHVRQACLGIDTIVRPEQVLAWGEPGVVALLNLATDEREGVFVRGRAARLLGARPDARVHALWASLRQSTESRLRVDAAWAQAMAARRSPVSFDVVVTDLLGDSDAAVREVALHVLWQEAKLAPTPARRDGLTARLAAHVDDAALNQRVQARRLSELQAR